MADPHALLRSQIRAGRELLALNQKQLAEHAGTSLSQISRAESGETKSGDILLEIKASLEKLGINFTRRGVEFSNNQLEVIEGENCFIQLLDRISRDLKNDQDKELLLMFASDSVSPPEVNMRYRALRKNGLKMRQLIRDGDMHIMGSLDEYRMIPEKYFTNIVTLIYKNNVAQVNGDETKIVIFNDSRLAERERKVFQYFWETGEKPKKSEADERFEQ